MTQKSFSVKALFAAVLAVVLLCCMSATSLAADSFQNLGGKYGLIVPTDSKLKAQKKSYTFYGDSGKLYFMRISKGKKNAKYAIEIFSDSSMKHKIRNLNNDFNETAGNKPISVSWKFRDVKSGKYYGRCYAYYLNDAEEKVIDSTTLETFTININRVGKATVKLKSLKNTVNGPKITWENLPTAEKYYVYRKVVGKKGWTKIATLGSTVTSYTDKKANSGNRYTYTVKCFDGKYNSLYNKKGLTIIYLNAPKLKTVSGTGTAGYAKISWGKVAGATGYKVYRKGGSLSDYQWTRIATIKNGKTTSYTDKKARSTDWHYTYTVIAYNSSSQSGYNSTGVDYYCLTAPTLKKASPYDTGMKIEWTYKNDNAEKYYIYRKVSGSWKKIGESRNKYFIDTKATSGSTYTYTVKAVSSANAGAYNSKGISAKFIGTPDISKITFNSKDASVVKWTKVRGAVGYNVYRKVNGAKKWSLIKQCVGNANTTFTDTVKKKSGDVFTYTVRAYDQKGKLGYYILKGVSGTFLSNPSFTASQIATKNGSLQIAVKWSAVKGADCYNVYRRIPGKSWSLLKTKTTALSFTDTTPQNGVIYDYAVRAVTNEGDMSRYNTVSAYATAVPVLNSVNLVDNGAKVIWSATSGATGYNIYKAPKDGGDWVKAGSVKAGVCEFTDTDPKALTDAYFYSVSAVINTVESSKSNKIGNFVEINAKAVFNTENATIDLSWESTEDTVVSIYKSVNDESPVLLEENLQYMSVYMDAFIEEGLTYTYTITASQPGKLSAASVVSAKYPYPPLASVELLSAEKTETDTDASCVLVWSKVDFADEYVVLRAPINGREYGEYTEIATVDKTAADDYGLLTYTDTEIEADGKYSYVIKAVATESERDSSLSNEFVIIVYKQLSPLTNFRYDLSLGENGNTVVTLSWAPVELAEKYIVTRKVLATGKVEILGEILPEVEIEGEDAILKTYFADETAENDVRYEYTVTAVAINRGEVANSTEYCNGTAYAYYADYNSAKAQLEAMLGEANTDENGKEIYVNDVYEEVKLALQETDSALQRQLPEENQATVDEATATVKALSERLSANAYITITFNDIEGNLITEKIIVTGSTLGTSDAPALPENTETHAFVGWVDADDNFYSEESVINATVTLTPAKEESKIILTEDAVISFTEDGFINGISAGTTVTEIKAQLSNDLTYVEIKNHLGEALQDDSLVGTGTTITLISKYTDVVYEKYAAVISADLDGNGIIDENDYTVALNAGTDATGTFTFNGEYQHCFFIAADLATDGFIDIFDVDTINSIIKNAQ